MKDDARLRLFITFVLLASAPKNRSVARQDFIQPSTPQLLPLTRFLEAALARVRDHEVSPGGIDGPERWLCINSRGEPTTA